MSRALTSKEFEDKLFSIFGERYTCVDEYKTGKIRIKVIHEKCGRVIEVTSREFYKGVGCSLCRIDKQTKTTEWFKNKVKEVCGDEFTVVGEYVASKKGVLMKHEVCGYEWEPTPDNFLRRKSRCPKCSGNNRTDTENFKKRLYGIVGNDYTMLEDYINARTPVLFRHNNCGHEWRVRPELFTRGDYGCPNCHISQGEEKVRRVLRENNIPYKREERFEDCKNKYPLPFDFTLYNNNNELLCIIEYDGIQHFKPIEHFGGEKAFKERVLSDSIKNKYCENNNIPLLRIPYTLETNNIEEVILEFYNREVTQGTTNQN